MRAARVVSWVLLWGVLVSEVGRSALAAEGPLVFSRLDLLDGRKLTNVVVRTYDAKTGRVLVVADGKAMMIPLAVVPPPFNEQLKSAPRSGESVSTVGQRRESGGTIATAADQYALETPGPAIRGNGGQRMANGVAVPRNPAPRVKGGAVAGGQATRRATPNEALAAQGGIDLAAHKAAALKRAQSYYRFEFRAGSDAIAVSGLELDVTTPKAVPGWEGRCRTEGKAYIEIFDSRGRSFQRRTSTFEVVTEKKQDDDDIVVVEFAMKT